MSRPSSLHQLMQHVHMQQHEQADDMTSPFEAYAHHPYPCHSPLSLPLGHGSGSATAASAAAASSPSAPLDEDDADDDELESIDSGNTSPSDHTSGSEQQWSAGEASEVCMSPTSPDADDAETRRRSGAVPAPAPATFASQHAHDDDDDDQQANRTMGSSFPRARTLSFPTRNAHAHPRPSCAAAAAAAAAASPAAHLHRSTRPRVMVTGGAGFIGSHVARALLQRGEDVCIVDELNDYYSPALKTANLRALLDDFGQRRVHVYVADVCDEAAMDACMKAEKCDRIIHLAARAGVRPSIVAPLLYEQANVRGTLTLLQLSVQHRISHFVYASSSSVYGDDTPAPFQEDHACNAPVSVYAATKKSCELLASSYAHLHSLPCSGLRFFTVYGENGRRDMAPFMFIDRLARGQPLNMFGDGSSERDYTYVSDIVAGVLRVLDHPPGQTLEPSTPGSALPPPMHEVYNLGVGSPIRLSLFIEAIAAALGVTPQIIQLPKQPGDVQRTFADISKARRMVGYAPKVSVHDGIKRTVAWYLKHVAPATAAAASAAAAAAAAAAAGAPKAPLKEAAGHALAAAPVASVVPASSTAQPAFPPLASSLCATRIHNGGSSRLGLSPDVLAHLLSWLPRALACTQWVAIAVDTTNNRRDIFSAVEAVLASLDAAARARVSVVCVSPWGAFSPALNALLAHAQSLCCDTILYSSLEMAMHPAHVRALSAHLDASTLVVGARLGGHRFVRGSAVIDGCSTVWNTLALWNCARLARTGFLPVSDGVPALTATEADPVTGEARTRVLRAAVASGVEEVTCISTQQLLFPASAQAKLLSMSSPDQETGALPAASASAAGAAASPAKRGAAAEDKGLATTSDPDDSTGEDDEEHARGPGLCLMSPAVLHNVRGAEARRLLPDGGAAAAAGNSELYDDVATPAQKEPGSGGNAMLRPQRTVSAPHAIVLPKSRLSRHNSGAAAHGGSSPALKAKDATVAASLMPSLRIPSLHWDADFGGDADRQAAHDRKMRSKIERAQQQLDHLSLRPGVVQHIHCTLTM